MPKSYKLACWAKSDSDPVYNGCRFATRLECEEYGRELWSRWTGLDRYEVHDSDDEINYLFDFAAYRATPHIFL